MNFELPADVQDFLSRIDAFIEKTVLPLQRENDNNRFFDYRREASRTQWDNNGLPAKDWEILLRKTKRLADDAGFYRFAVPQEYGGSGSASLNLHMCAVRYHLTSHPVYGGGVSLANDLQSEHSVVGNIPFIILIYHYGTQEQKDTLIPAAIRGDVKATFGLTEVHHGSDATHMDTVARRITLPSGEPGYEINGNKKWQSGMHHASYLTIFARTSGKAGDAKGITAFLVPQDTPGVEVVSYQWTLNMPTDHATVALNKVCVPTSAILGPIDNGLAIAQSFTHENRIRQAAASCGAARYCIDRSVEYANRRHVFGKPLSRNQAIQWPLVELSTQVEMLRLLILRTAVEMDRVHAEAKATGKAPWVAIERQLGHKIGMCNYYAARLACQSADRAMQIHGGDGYSRHYPFEHIWRHFRRYRITEGSEEVQIRKVAAYLFGYKTTGEEKTQSTPKQAKI
ncbi:putative acyl- dehydrogenase protein [Phaeoacremonium minimum UCRPA7]|uniref:Putative acyl-dehydrogenase protein n=1 Tax=Phaeoacremonium minimum (strain UCR-PA7) TaxID=1286976 RepID=R8BGJ5_PHAM7|nr:putative acyl- dehydrogenase protein [Phaeoacremonium minimum UCRPA7]EON98409.1 putative acyl- dehydrogenase protein [Phaeoacremonium minimum UCRPA7]